jgi:hypothetical protein
MPATTRALTSACRRAQLSRSAVLAHIFLKEQLNMFGILGCVLCITGSVTIVMHVPVEAPIESVAQVWNLAMQPGACVQGGASSTSTTAVALDTSLAAACTAAEQLTPAAP